VAENNAVPSSYATLRRSINNPQTAPKSPTQNSEEPPFVLARKTGRSPKNRQEILALDLD
jgi:hypothetical protein